MQRAGAWLFATFVALQGPHGHAIWVQPANVVAVLSDPGVGDCPTVVTTMSSTVYVCETPEEVVRKLNEAK